MPHDPHVLPGTPTHTPRPMSQGVSFSLEPETPLTVQRKLPRNWLNQQDVGFRYQFALTVPSHADMAILCGPVWGKSWWHFRAELSKENYYFPFSFYVIWLWFLDLQGGVCPSFTFIFHKLFVSSLPSLSEHLVHFLKTSCLLANFH